MMLSWPLPGTKDKGKVWVLSFSIALNRPCKTSFSFRKCTKYDIHVFAVVQSEDSLSRYFIQLKIMKSSFIPYLIIDKTQRRTLRRQEHQKMDINKVDLLLKYILAAAGEEDFGNREVGPIHLIKYVYLADLAEGVS